MAPTIPGVCWPVWFSSHLSADAVCWLVPWRSFDIGTAATVRSKSIALQSFKDGVRTGSTTRGRHSPWGTTLPRSNMLATPHDRSGDLGNPEYGVRQQFWPGWVITRLTHD